MILLNAVVQQVTCLGFATAKDFRSCTIPKTAYHTDWQLPVNITADAIDKLIAAGEYNSTLHPECIAL